jgi:hypothetical protein
MGYAEALTEHTIIAHSHIVVSDEDRDIIAKIHKELAVLKEQYKRHEENPELEPVNPRALVKLVDQLISVTERLKKDNNLSNTNYDVHPETGEFVIYQSGHSNRGE